MSEMHVILKLTDSEGTSITLKGVPLEEVMEEFHAALSEQRFMDVGMNRPGYTHRINPQQVAFIHTLDY
ncbi:hypothetical protein B1A87_006995 [Arthrobacter sp. KBS0703]|uniref:hypothetical protein n=1 Tax=Arthrobacter sp. KBS0703 TaxID=1955698 RepID=UPI0011163F51|nr:hypothetical protein [Arthrobacter sp. KBS0703]TSE15685.1 hypothetical protein B1A87_006995 [Arthrobacter sp. KBS0703]